MILNSVTENAKPRTHPLSYPSGLWRCPATGVIIPKTPWRNLQLRQQVFAATAASAEERELWYGRCQESPLLWLNLFAFTYLVKEIDADGIERPAKHPFIPFITWPVQDDGIMQLVECIESGEDAIIDKSRDMGASWIVCALADWYWLFRPDSHSLLVSRVEDLVDAPGDPDTLFWKIDFLNRNLPPWMLPTLEPGAYQRGGSCRSHMSLKRDDTNSTVMGQATTAHVGRAGRKTFVVFDEMAAIQHATAAWQSAADTTACRIGNSTPLGPGTEFTKQRNHGLATGSPRVVVFDYSDHPGKGGGREWRIDEDGSRTGIVGLGYWWSPWFEAEWKRRQDPMDMAQNILHHHTTSGDLFFNSTVVTQHAQLHGRDPRRCEVLERTGKKDGEPEYYFVDDPQGRWYCWFEGERPPAERNFVGFADLGKGMGASNSVCAWMDVEDGAIAAEFVDPIISTHDMAEEVAIAGKHLFNGDYDMALLGWEVNGPGEDWHKDLLRHDYTFLYHRRQVGRRVEKRTKEYGWRSGRKEKRVLLTRLRRAMTRGGEEDGVTIRSRLGLGEMLEYRYFDDGSIGPSRTYKGNPMADETSGAREAHGDRVVAYAGVVLMRSEVAKFERPIEGDRPGTFGHFLEMGDILDKDDEIEQLLEGADE